MTTLSAKKIYDALNELNIPFEVQGDINSNFYFKSFRKIENNGIYYVQDFRSKLIAENIQQIKLSAFLSNSFFDTDASNCIIKVENPQLTYYKLMNYFNPSSLHPGIHPTAIIDPEAKISKYSHIGPYCILGKCTIEDHVHISSHVIINDACFIAKNTEIAAHVEIGAKGVAWIWDESTGQRIKQPQLGGTIIEEACFIGSGVTIVRGSVNENTLIGAGTVIAPGSKIGHGAIIGVDNHLANNVSIAGNVTTGARCFFGSAAVVRPMITLNDDVIVGAGSVVVKNSTESGVLLMGVPSKETTNSSDKLSGVPKFIKKADSPRINDDE